MRRRKRKRDEVLKLTRWWQTSKGWDFFDRDRPSSGFRCYEFVGEQQWSTHSFREAETSTRTVKRRERVRDRLWKETVGLKWRVDERKVPLKIPRKSDLLENLGQDDKKL
jgi:hypothetical protein